MMEMMRDEESVFWNVGDETDPASRSACLLEPKRERIGWNAEREKKKRLPRSRAHFTPIQGTNAPKHLPPNERICDQSTIRYISFDHHYQMIVSARASQLLGS